MSPQTARCPECGRPYILNSGEGPATIWVTLALAVLGFGTLLSGAILILMELI